MYIPLNSGKKKVLIIVAFYRYLSGVPQNYSVINISFLFRQDSSHEETNRVEVVALDFSKTSGFYKMLEMAGRSREER